MHTPLAAIRIACLLLLVLLGPAGNSFGQSTTDPEESDRFQNRSRTSTGARAPAASPFSPVLEGAVDPATYKVGPGDLFNVVIGGAEPTVAPVFVSASGHLVIPNVGSILVTGRNLDDVTAAVRSHISRYFRNVGVEVSLVQPRQFYVHVTGAVPRPGRYVAQPVARLESVLREAFSKENFELGNSDFLPALRNVRITRRDGAQLEVDLHRYKTSGDLRHNPFVEDGDVIIVGAYAPSIESVFIDGSIPFPGIYQYRHGDTVLDLLSLGTGVESPSAGHIRLTRRDAEGRMLSQTLDVGAMLRGEQEVSQLRPLDHVFVPEPSRTTGSVVIEGAVHFPGTYPIDPGVTTIQELLEIAGGLTDDALVHAITLRRPTSLPPSARRLQTIGQNHIEPEQIPEGWQWYAAQARTRGSALPYTSRAYLAEEFSSANRIAVGGETLVTGSDAMLTLRDGDRLIIPHNENTILVFGQVMYSGHVPFSPGMLADDYIRAAGGLTAIASEAFVIEAGTMRHVPAHQASVRPGDAIFVNKQAGFAGSPELASLEFDTRRLELDQQRLRSENRTRTTQTILQVVGTITSVLTTYLVLYRTN
jgi:polysaccharide biosynthesis/export protein